MLDPVPFKPPPLMAAAAKKVGDYLGLNILHLHIHEILFAAVFYHTVCLNISPFISSRLFPKTYSKLPTRTKINWDVHVVSLVQSIIIVCLAFYVIRNDGERALMDSRERIYGYTGACGLVQALGIGYFLWDLWISIVHVDIFGLGLLAHAISAFYVYSMGLRPFTNYYAPNFILFELSSPFLNVHWFLDKLDMTGSNLQLVNGIMLMSTFFGSRLIWGVYQSYRVFSEMFEVLQFQKTPAGQSYLLTAAAPQPGIPGLKTQTLHYVGGREIPAWYAYTYLVSNITLTLLNIYWFGKMIETIRKRFDPPFGTRKPEVKKENGKEVLVGRGVLGDGTKTVEIDMKEVRRRKPPADEVPPPQ